MNTHIHKKYESLTIEIKKIPDGNFRPIRTFCNKRNTVELTTIGENNFVVKKYKVPNIFNRIIYTFFRRSKARRAYENAQRIIRHGISTPFPVAYIETKRGGLFHTGYFISEYMEHPTLENIKENITGAYTKAKKAANTCSDRNLGKRATYTNKRSKSTPSSTIYCKKLSFAKYTVA